MSCKCWLQTLAIHINNFRVIPRLILVAYWHLCWQMIHWYMALGNPTTNQTTFVSIVTGLFPIVIGLYLKTGGIVKLDNDDKPPNP